MAPDHTYAIGVPWLAAMTIIENPVLAMPVRPEGRLSFRQFLRLVRENTLGTYPPEAFDDEIIAGRLLWHRRFIINEPSGIRHVLLDNAANYRKSELTRRLLEPGLGRGLLTSEGETWRRHRRIMAPAFDRRSMEGYAPIITGVTSELLARWDVLPNLSEADVGAAMMHTTLHVISRAMFSANRTCLFTGVSSSDNPRLNAFCRVAPSLRLRLLAIFPAGVLLRAADFNSRTFALVQARLFEFLLAMNAVLPTKIVRLYLEVLPNESFRPHIFGSVVGVDESGSVCFLICPAAVIFWSYFRLS